MKNKPYYLILNAIKDNKLILKSHSLKNSVLILIWPKVYVLE